MNNKIGLALGGGGARGSYQIGILKALDEANILDDIHHISGSSIGAINTLMVMAKISYERMVEIWQQIDNSDIYGTGPDRLKMDRLGLFSLKDIFSVLSREISLSEIRNSKIQGYATAAKIKKDSLINQVLIHRMEKEVFHLNDFKDPHKAVLASASIPVLFGSTSIDDDHYVDGGAVDNCPIQPLLDQGCDIIIAVPIDGWFRPKKYHNQNILLINLETHYLFSMIPYDIFDFRPKIVSDKAEYGYRMG
ncbi:MAG: patatin-like phospholipase family protein, partial [Bacillota bacterium]